MENCTLEVSYCKTDPNAIVPVYSSAGAAGADLHACLSEPVTILPGERKFVSSGIALAIPDGYSGFLLPRSGMACKRGITLANAPGLIDSDYRGTVMCCLLNTGKEAQTIRNGERIAQLVLVPVGRAAWKEAPALNETTRGTGGFGSTGI